MRIAAIDIGTNTVLLLVADIGSGGDLRPVAHQQRFPRLGQGVDRSGHIPPEAFERLVAVINEYTAIARTLSVERIVACATSAVRDAANREELLARLGARTGIIPEVLSGEDEALLTFRGAVSGLPGLEGPAAVIDVGGGSTEITYRPADGGKALHRVSVQVGSLRLTERFFMHDPPEISEVRNAREFINAEGSKFGRDELKGIPLVGVAGTATTLACLDQGLKEFEVGKVRGYILSRERIGEWGRKLSGLTAREIRALSSATEGRADILAAGALILHGFMHHLGSEAMTVSERGLRYGMALREWDGASGDRSPAGVPPDEAIPSSPVRE